MQCMWKCPLLFERMPENTRRSTSRNAKRIRSRPPNFEGAHWLSRLLKGVAGIEKVHWPWNSVQAKRPFGKATKYSAIRCTQVLYVVPERECKLLATLHLTSKINPRPVWTSHEKILKTYHGTGLREFTYWKYRLYCAPLYGEWSINCSS